MIFKNKPKSIVRSFKSTAIPKLKPINAKSTSTEKYKEYNKVTACSTFLL